VDAFCTENNFRAKVFDDDALRALEQLPWRGNARELRNAVERLIIMTAGDVVRAADLPAGLGMALAESGADILATGEGAVALRTRDKTLQEFKDAAERSYLVDRLRENDWNIAATAKAIDTPRSNLYKKLDAYAIQRERDAGQS
jgi:two-component system nitrogen regulation response regulator NtrX